jgi:hypothetical protein
MAPISYRRHRFPPVVIQHAVWLYLRFTLSYRDVEELLAERGLDLSYGSGPETAPSSTERSLASRRNGCPDRRQAQSAIIASSRPAAPPPIWSSQQECLPNDPPDSPFSSRAGHETRATHPDQALKPALLLDVKIDDLREPRTSGSNPLCSSGGSTANPTRPLACYVDGYHLPGVGNGSGIAIPKGTHHYAAAGRQSAAGWSVLADGMA